MNSKTIIAIVIVIIIVLGGAYFFMNKGASDSAGAPQAQSGTQEASGASPMSLKDLLAAGTSQTCTFTDDTSGSSGTVYVSGGKMRGDFSANNQGKTMGMHMINDGTNIYTWMDGMASGYKMTVSATQSSATGAPQQPQQGFDQNKKMNYNCSPWTADAGQFNLPTGITFNDMSAMMQGGAGANVPTPTPGGSPTGAPPVKGTAAQCAQCAQLPAAQQSMCKAALHC